MRKKRYYKPAEVEAILNSTRETEGYTGDTERIAMQNIIETAKLNGRIGDKDLVVVPPKYIHIPKWQRRLDITKSEKIGFHYNKNKWEVPKVIYHNGVLVCVDGMHRIFGAYVGGVEGVVVEILDITEKEAIELFLNQTADRTQMRPHDYLNASLAVEKAEYVVFKEICHKHHVQIKGDDSLRNPIGVFTSLSDGVSLCRANPKTLDNILNIIIKLNWNNVNSDNGNAFGAKYVRIFKKLYSYYGDRATEMENILLGYCWGSEWFIMNAENMTQNQLFDELSMHIKENLPTKLLKAV